MCMSGGPPNCSPGAPYDGGYGPVGNSGGPPVHPCSALGFKLYGRQATAGSSDALCRALPKITIDNALNFVSN